MALKEHSRVMLPAIDKELRRQVRRFSGQSTRGFHALLAYHMGWNTPARPRRMGGKRIRPLLTLLACASVSERWREAVPAAAAVELVHNFSLVHDDIQDNSPTRRGRPTLWKRAGVPIAINAGDALYAAANLAMLDLSRAYEASVVATALGIIEQACLDLTRGQYLDLAHQRQRRMRVQDYWKMIDGKTAALLAACTEVGALLGGASPIVRDQYRRFGHLVGRAFQVQDDILGIWGDEKHTGKSSATDLLEGKLSLPVVFALGKSKEFARAWNADGGRSRSPTRLRRLLDETEAGDYAARHARRLTRAALNTLRSLRHGGGAGAALEELTQQLLARSQ